MVKPLLENLSLKEAIKQQRLYICNLRILDNLPCSDGRKICAPMSLFFVTAKEEFVPIAIQLHQEKGPYNPVFLPTDSEYTWMLAKMYYNNADAAIHQASTHIAFTHVVVESFAVCTHRNLSPSHPVFRLLAPHFFYTMAINE
ncbi:hydroperoxide isomerase ALOXE3-like [Glandiceps talaboti]